MRVRCPHCHSPADWTDQDEQEELTCPSCGSAFHVVSGLSTAQWDGGQRRIGQFELIEQVGIGHFGKVWKARDSELDRVVAVKIPRKEQLSAEESAQFFREARATAQLRHPHIVGVHEVGRDGDTIYIVSDFVAGASLREWLSGQRLTPREAAAMVATIADAVHHAHEQGVIHRDLKPANIMLDMEGQPRVMDFGLARRETGEITMTVDGRIIGTPAYMSPEQARGEGHRADRRSDIYSLGVILFELLTGELPFRGETRMLVVQILQDEPPALRKLNNRTPRDLETICLKCLQKNPAKRYQTAAELAADLRLWLEGKPIHARPVGRVERAVRWCQRRPAVAGLLGTVAAVTLIGFGAVLWQWHEATIARDAAQENFERSERHRQRRELNHERALAAVDKMLTHVGEIDLAASPEFAPLRKAVLEDALKMYEEFAQEAPQDLALRMEVAKAWMRVGAISVLLKDEPRAVTAYETAQQHWQTLLRERPQDPTVIEGFYFSSTYASRNHTMLGQHQEARRHNALAVALGEQMARQRPDDLDWHSRLAAIYGQQAQTFEGLGQSTEAEAAWRQCLEQYERAYGMAGDLPAREPIAGGFYWRSSLFARFLERRGRGAEAIPILLRTVEIVKQNLDRFGTSYQSSPSPIYQPSMARNHRSRPEDLAGLYRRLANLTRDSDAEAAKRYMLEAERYDVAHLGDLKSRVTASDNSYLELYARACQERATRQAQAGKPADAERSMREGLEHLDRLIEQAPDEGKYRLAAGTLALHLGRLLSGPLERDAEAAIALRSAIEHFERLSSDLADDPERAADRIAALRMLGETFQVAGDRASARQAIANALDVAAAKLRDAGESNSHAAIEAATREAGECYALLLRSLEPGPDQAATGKLIGDSAAALSALIKPENEAAEALAWQFHEAAPVFEQLGEQSLAADMSERAVALQKTVLKSHASVDDKIKLVYMQSRLANRLSYGLRRSADAEKRYREILATLDSILAENPNHRPALEQRIWNTYNIAGAIVEPARSDEALNFLLDCVATLDSHRDLDFSDGQRTEFRLRLAKAAIACSEIKAAQLATAAQQAEQATKETPASGDAWRCLGLLRLRQGDWPATITACQRAIELNADPTGECHLGIAVAHLRSGDEQRGAELQKTALQRFDFAKSASWLQALLDHPAMPVEPATR